MVLVLLAAWIAAYLACRAALILTGEHRRSVAMCFAMLVMAVAPAMVGQLFDSIIIAVVITGIAAGLLRVFLQPKLRTIVPPPRAPLPSPWALGFAGLALALVAWTAIIGHYWDENAAHFAVGNAVAHGLLPPEHPLFPGEPFRYHYAFNILVGEVRAFAVDRVTTAIDTVTIACFALLLATASAAGATLAGRAGAGLAMLLVPLGAGTLQYVLWRDFGAIEVRVPGTPNEWLANIPPAMISNFFQHPQGVAMSASLAVVMMFDGRDQRLSKSALGALMLGMCSLAHVVFFGVLGLAIGVSVLVRAVRTKAFARAFAELLMLAAALALAASLGGFFAPGGNTPNLLTFDRDFFSEPLLRRLAHHLVLFGLPLLGVPFALARTKQKPMDMRVILLVAVFVGFVIPNVMTYKRSWDIVKFLGVGMFFANLLFADVLAQLSRRRVVTAILVALTTSTCWLWLARSSVFDGRIGIHSMHFQPPPPIAEAVAEKLRPLVGPRQRVLSTNVDMSRGGGFLTPGFNWRQLGVGYMMDRDRVDTLFVAMNQARRNLDPAALETLDVDFMILSPGDITTLTPDGQASLRDPTRFEKMFEVNHEGQTRHVYRVLR